MMRTTSLVFFAASMAIIFAFFYQIDTVGAAPKRGGRGGGGKVLFKASNQQHTKAGHRIFSKGIGRLGMDGAY